MKRLIPLLLLIAVPFLISPVQAQAADADSKPPSHVSITVVMPDPAAEKDTASFPSLPKVPGLDPAPEAPTSNLPKLYPTNIYEVLENGVRWIVKTYELGAGESPADIPRDSFERSAGTSGAGWNYSLTDITKKETASADVREHVEVAKLNTGTKDMEAILRQLEPTMEFTSEDGYTGVLALDVASIKVETAGTKTTSYTASAKREYPHLSSNDTSLLPKSITDGGRTLNLASVEWKTNYTMTVDYEQIPASYTAVVTYTAPASNTVVTGYNTTAEYKGSLSKLNQGVTIYTAYFMGTEIVPERTPLEIIDPEETGEDTAEVEETEEQTADDEKDKSPLLSFIPIALFILLLGLGAGYYIPRILKNKKEKGEPIA